MATLLGMNADTASLLRTVQQVAVLVQGNWIVRSDILYPKDTASSISGVPAELMCQGRDYIVSWKQFLYKQCGAPQTYTHLPAYPISKMWLFQLMLVGVFVFFVVKTEHCSFEVITHALYSVMSWVWFSTWRLVFLMETFIVLLSPIRQVLGWYLRPESFPSASFHICHWQSYSSSALYNLQ